MELIQSIQQFRRIPLNLEFKGLIVSALSFILFPYLIRFVDASAAAIDPGILSGILLSIAAVLFFQATTWWVIKAIWPAFAIYSRDQFEGSFKRLPGRQKVVVYLGFYLALLYAFIMVLAQLI
ncbi:hypothetical protein [Daejeonella lutea]|uniref:Uncharacterized protein n=1 Tax=Daejeonella lutea TaxID=572036 RepID=A0A1T5CXF9_9SPHI|nr:hypothetical protein [Daejeonella lutea]SKB64185.1 hypothetical protein SAMN05661099_2000 [Daejeonella lutea]